MSMKKIIDITIEVLIAILLHGTLTTFEIIHPALPFIEIAVTHLIFYLLKKRGYRSE